MSTTPVGTTTAAPGSGDLTISTAGAQREQIQIPNVLLLDRCLTQLQILVTERPD